MNFRDIVPEIRKRYFVEAKIRKCRKVCLRQKGHQRSNSTQLPRFGFHRIVHITEMLQVGRRIGLDHIVGVVEKFNDLVQVWVAPVNTRYAWKSRE